MKWFWITLGAIVGVPLVYHFGYLLWSSILIPVNGDEDMILRAIFCGHGDDYLYCDYCEQA